ncbi:receptor like protein 44 [Wolffia australiana]
MAEAPPLQIIFFLLLLLQATAGEREDEACLANLYKSFEDKQNNLRNWTAANFASPCNGFTSFLDGATCNNGRVFKLALPSRSLSGGLAAGLGGCADLQTLDLSSNELVGPIPPELHLLSNLAVLNLSANRFSGVIPAELSLCVYLNVIDLHGNLLSGEIPQQLGFLARLTVFDVSGNNLQGEVPALLANFTGGAPRFNVSSFAGNSGLRGFPLPPARGGGLTVAAIVCIGLASGAASLLLSFAVVCAWIRADDRKRALAKSSHPNSPPPSLL